MGKMRNACNISIGKFGGKKPLENLRSESIILKRIPEKEDVKL
jgi:hypothetical protein